MPQQLLVIGPRRIILFQAGRYEVLKLCGEFVSWQSWRIILNYLKQRHKKKNISFGYTCHHVVALT